MQKRIRTYALLALLFCLQLAQAQTAGIGEVSSIEAKVATLEGNKAKVAKIKEELAGLQAAWSERINKLRNELAALYKERDDLIADMKVGAKCSQCGKYKSEFEKAGENFQEHLGKVKGYAVPATTTELEATRKLYTEKIAMKKVQIKNVEEGDNPVARKMKEITALEQANEGLCKEITAHSKRYETAVFAEARSKHENWTGSLAVFATNILIADDKATIFKDRILRLEREFKKEAELLSDQVKKENSAQQNQKNGQVLLNQQKMTAVQDELNQSILPLETQIRELKNNRREAEEELKKPRTADSVKTRLRASLSTLSAQISALEKNILDQKTSARGKIAALENDNKRLKDEVFQLQANLPKQQAQAVEKIKAGYDRKKAEAGDGVTRSLSELATARTVYSEKATYYKKQNQFYIDEVVAESNRMVLAGQKVSCPVWNEIRFMVATNWNKVFPCVNALTTLAKPYSTHIFNSYCPGQTTSRYLASYKSFVMGLSAEDREAVRGNSNADWFEQLTQ